MVDPPAERARVATTGEASAVAELQDRFNREFGDDTPGPAVLTARLARLLSGGQLVALVVGTPPVGFGLLSLRASVWYDGPVALLEELYVQPEQRGRGLGAALLSAAEQHTRQRGGGLLEINVDSGDTAARRFYQRHGYSNRKTGTEETFLYYYRELPITAADR